MNYPPTAKLMGWASEVIDSPNGNALLRFCLVSELVPKPDNMFKPCFLIFMLALKSLSCAVLQLGQVHSLSFRVRSANPRQLGATKMTVAHKYVAT